MLVLDDTFLFPFLLLFGSWKFLHLSPRDGQDPRIINAFIWLFASHLDFWTQYVFLIMHHIKNTSAVDTYSKLPLPSLLSLWHSINLWLAELHLLPMLQILSKITDTYRNMQYFSCTYLMHFTSPTATLAYSMTPSAVESLLRTKVCNTSMIYRAEWDLNSHDN